MRDSDDLDDRSCWSINYGVGKKTKEKFSRTLQMRRPTLRIATNCTYGVFERSQKAAGRGRVALSIPTKGGSGFSDGFRMEFNAWRSHEIARGFGDARRPKERLLPFPYLTRRYAARSPYSIELPRPRRPNHLSFQLDDRLVRLALRQVDGERLLRLFCDSCSCSEFYISYSRQHKPETPEAIWLRTRASLFSAR
jgi:hypothetical protein